MAETQIDPKDIKTLYRETARALLPLFDDPRCSPTVAARIQDLVEAIYEALNSADRRRPRSVLRLIKNFLV
jgi:molybdopterin-guanine dinucleotide biosynthesis protein A